MKKIILILFLLTQINYSQSFLLLFDGYTPANSEVSTYNNSLTTKLSDIQLARIDRLVTMIKDSLGVTSLTSAGDWLYLFANETQEAALKNVIKRSHDGQLVGTSATFTQWQGFTGSGAGYINTNWNISTQKVSYTQNSATFGFYNRTNGTSTGVVGAVTDVSGYGVAALVRNTSTNIWRINNAGTLAGSTANSSGHYSLTRRASDSIFVYRNGVELTKNAVVSSSNFLNGNMYLLGSNSNGTANLYVNYQIAIAYAFKGLTALQARKLNNCFEWYMDQLGTGVQ